MNTPSPGLADPASAPPHPLSALGLSASDFELMNLPQRFSVDASALDARWKALQREVHPDRFAADGAAAQRVAMQWSVRVNEAYQRLKHPVRRAAYLCELAGVAVDAERNTAMPAAFLMQQMEWREALDDARTADALDALADEVRQTQRQQLAELARLLDPVAPASQPSAEQAQAAAQVVRALMFVERFAQDVNQRLDALDDAASTPSGA
jgi:molecular chaperone HscB